MVIINSIIHFMVNGISAYSVSAGGGANSAYAYVFYMICACVLTLPLGISADYVISKIGGKAFLVRRRFYWGMTVLGILFSLVGLYAGVYALGAGNALVSVGCGMSCFDELSDRKNKSIGIGIFMAAGIPGITVGEIIAEFTSVKVISQTVWIVITLLMTLIGSLYIIMREHIFEYIPVNADETAASSSEESDRFGEPVAVKERFAGLVWGIAGFVVSAICFYQIFGVETDWKTEIVYRILSLALISGGVIAGSFLSERFAIGKKNILCTVMALATVASGLCGLLCSIIIISMAVMFLSAMTVMCGLCELGRRFYYGRGMMTGMILSGCFAGFLMNM